MTVKVSVAGDNSTAVIRYDQRIPFDNLYTQARNNRKMLTCIANTTHASGTSVMSCPISASALVRPRRTNPPL
jgi:hypothetical protein